MKKFKNMRTIEDITSKAIDLGFEVDLTEWDKGGDWFTIRDMDNRFIQILVNCFGSFLYIDLFPPNLLLQKKVMN